MIDLRGRLRRHVTWPRVVFTLIFAFWFHKFLDVEPYTLTPVTPNGTYQRVFRGSTATTSTSSGCRCSSTATSTCRQLAQWGDPLGTKTLPTDTGKNFLYPVGSAMLELPAFAIAHGVAKVRNAFGDDVPMTATTATTSGGRSSPS